MKKHLFLSLLAITAAAGTAMAQEGASSAVTVTPAPTPAMMQQKQPNERTKETLLKLQDALPLMDGQGGKIYPIFFQYYTSLQKAMEDMRASGTMDREKIKEMRDKLSADRDKQLAGYLSAEQMKKWKDEIEPSMHPQRRGDGDASKQK